MAAELIDNYCEKSETPLAQKINTHNIRSELVVSQSPRMFFSRKLVSGWRQQDQETVAASSFDDHITSASHKTFKDRDAQILYQDFESARSHYPSLC